MATARATPTASPKILVLSRAVLGTRMAGPGIRSYHIARVLAEQLPHAKVTLAAPDATDLDTEGLPFDIVEYTPKMLGALARRHDIMIAYSLPLGLIPHTIRTRVVLDLYGVFFPEWLEIATTALKPRQRRPWFEAQRQHLNVQLSWADFILHSNDRQRHLYLGMLSALGRVTPKAYERDRSLRNMLGLTPFGVRPGEPEATKRVLKGVRPGIEPDDKVLIWNGAITGWYDVEILIRAMHTLSRERSDIKLFFMGTELPDIRQPPKLQGMGAGTVKNAMKLCEELDILDKFVFFNIDWVSYEHTVNYLLEADIGVCTYFDSLETDYAFRTRLLDLFWTERPIICTQGDVLSDLVTQRGLGIAIAAGDQRGLEEAIRALADDDAFAQACRTHLKALKEEYRWERTLKPLVEYCSNVPDSGQRKRDRLFQVAFRLGGFGAARVWQLVRSRQLGPRYL